MKIWKAELILRMDNDNWITDFSFKQEKREYEASEIAKHWRCYENWTLNTVPMDMEITKLSYGKIAVVQGFDHCLTDEELKQLETDMRKLMRKQLDYEKGVYLKEYIDRANAIKQW